MDDQVTNNTMGSKDSVSIETSDSTPLKKPNKLMLKLKISKNNLKNSYGGGSNDSNQHVCPVCSKGFTSGKALGGHIRIHMLKGNNNGSRNRKISKRCSRNNAKPKKKISNLDDEDQESTEKVSCCICNKDFKSMKSLFGHMRNHPERSWRGIRPPPSDKNSCCSSVSENYEAFSAIEVVDQVKGSSSVSDLVKSLPNWTNTGKRFEKSSSDEDENEIPEAAYCLMKLSRGESFDLNHMKTKIPASESKGKAKVKTEYDQFLTEELNEEDTNNRFSVRFKKIPLIADGTTNKKRDPYRGKRHGFFYPQNPNQVRSPKVQLDFDLNELPYVEGLDDADDDQA